MKNMEVVLIEWKDATLHGDTQRALASKDFRLMHGFATGILICEDEESLTLAMDYFDEEEYVRCVTTYPKSGIQNIRRLGWLNPAANQIGIGANGTTPPSVRDYERLMGLP